MKIKEDKKEFIIKILALVILVLVAVVVYLVALKPAMDRHILEKQIEAQNILLNNIVLQIEQTGYIQIPVGNQSLYLAPFNPASLQQPQQIEEVQ